MSKHVVVIGGGAAGFFAAIHIKRGNPNVRVTLLEKSSKLLAKVKVSGGGRCNVTHACFDPALLCSYYPRGGNSLRGGFHTFHAEHTMAWFEAHGVSLKIESDGRVFPVTDDSQTVVDCLVGVAKTEGVSVRTQSGVLSVEKTDRRFVLVLAQGGEVVCDQLVLATGSGRGGYALAKSLGHQVLPLLPSLFSFKVADPMLHALRGVSVEDAVVWLQGFKGQQQRGGLLVTHWGLSGPAVIKLSAWQAERLHAHGYAMALGVNSLPALSEQEVLGVLRCYAGRHAGKAVHGRSPFEAVSRRLWCYGLSRVGILEQQLWGTLSHKAFSRIQQSLQHAIYDVVAKGPFKEEFVTCGGVSLKEIDMRTMRSKCCDGLYVVGECLDVDGVTGGFNFQHAWTSGYVAACAIASS